MVKTAHAGKSDNLRTERGSCFDRPTVRRISEPSVNSFGVVVADIISNSPMQMPLVEHDHVVEELSPAGPDPSFGDPVLPWAPIGRHHRLRTEAPDGLSGAFGEDRVAVVDEVDGWRCLGECFAELLHDPLRRRVRGDVEVNHPSTSVSKDEPDVQHSEANGRDSEEVHRRDAVSVIPKEGPPALWLLSNGESLWEISRHRGKADREAKPLEFGLNLPCSPGILGGQPTNELLHLLWFAKTHPPRNHSAFRPETRGTPTIESRGPLKGPRPPRQHRLP